MNHDKISTTRTPARKLAKEDLSTIMGKEQALILGCCTQGCCDHRTILGED